MRTLWTKGVRAHVLKQEGDPRQDEELKQYLKDRGIEEVLIGEEPPDEDEGWEEEKVCHGPNPPQGRTPDVDDDISEEPSEEVQADFVAKMEELKDRLDRIEHVTSKRFTYGTWRAR